MTVIAQITTIIRNDELDTIDQLAEGIADAATEPTDPDRNGTIRALIRYGLEHSEDFVAWLDEQANDGIDPTRELGTDVASTTTTEES